MGQSDGIVFNWAKSENRLVLTRNYDDFLLLHQKTSSHPGILVVCLDNDSSKDLSRKAIVKAIANIETAQIPLASEFVVLNQWNY